MTASIDVSASGKLYKLVLGHIAKSNNDGGRLEASIAAAKGKRSKKQSCCGGGECSLTDTSSADRIALEAGLGNFNFVDFHNNVLTATHHIIGQPVGTNCEAVLYKTLTVSCHEGKEKLIAFFNELVLQSETATAGFIQIYHWHNKYRYWNESLRIKARPLDSVILPNKTTTAILQDLDSFIAQETQDFYEKHGIPYRRSYLFYGVPGAGKTSCIQAIAGAYKRSVAYLNIDPEMTDDGLRSAMDDLPEDTIVVLEDVDALFTKDRQAKNAKSTLTFTGLLNALDGVGSSLGQLFILTTNLREELDSALIRNGRVDMQIFFDYADDEQIIKMWNMFYPPTTNTEGEGIDLAAEFCRVLRTKLEGKTIAPCALQHFFVSQRTKTAQEALNNVDGLLEDLRQKEVEENKKNDEKKSKEGKGDKEEKNDDDDDDDDDDKKVTKVTKGKENDASTNVHIHFHGVTTTTSTTEPMITTTTPASNTVNIIDANNRSITVTIVPSTGIIPTKDDTLLSMTKENDNDNKIVDKHDNDNGNHRNHTNEEEVVVAQAIDETKTA